MIAKTVKHLVPIVLLLSLISWGCGNDENQRSTSSEPDLHSSAERETAQEQPEEIELDFVSQPPLRESTLDGEPAVSFEVRLKGDGNSDLRVDSLDFNRVIDHFGDQVGEGPGFAPATTDHNQDGKIGPLDMNVLIDRFGGRLGGFSIYQDFADDPAVKVDEFSADPSGRDDVQLDISPGGFPRFTYLPQEGPIATMRVVPQDTNGAELTDAGSEPVQLSTVPPFEWNSFQPLPGIQDSVFQPLSFTLENGNLSAFLIVDQFNDQTDRDLLFLQSDSPLGDGSWESIPILEDYYTITMADPTPLPDGRPLIYLQNRATSQALLSRLTGVGSNVAGDPPWETNPMSTSAPAPGDLNVIENGRLHVLNSTTSNVLQYFTNTAADGTGEWSSRTIADMAGAQQSVPVALELVNDRPMAVWITPDGTIKSAASEQPDGEGDWEIHDGPTLEQPETLTTSFFMEDIDGLPGVFFRWKGLIHFMINDQPDGSGEWTIHEGIRHGWNIFNSFDYQNKPGLSLFITTSDGTEFRAILADDLRGEAKWTVLQPPSLGQTILQVEDDLVSVGLNLNTQSPQVTQGIAQNPFSGEDGSE